MIHSYGISGMTCEGCLHKVKHYISQIPGVAQVDVSLENHTATVTMDRHVDDAEIVAALGGPGSKYKLESAKSSEPIVAPIDSEQAENRSWLETYKPILLIFGYISTATLLIQLKNDAFDGMEFMRHFMAGFFLTFSFFKLLNLKAFAESYAMYDVIARSVPFWGYLYALIELWLGIAYLVDFNPLATNLMAFVVMSVSIVGVLQSVLNKKRIQCACLGAVFNLPMSTVTIIEDGLMILMSGLMIWLEVRG